MFDDFHFYTFLDSACFLKACRGEGGGLFAFWFVASKKKKKRKLIIGIFFILAARVQYRESKNDFSARIVKSSQFANFYLFIFISFFFVFIIIF